MSAYRPASRRWAPGGATQAVIGGVQAHRQADRQAVARQPFDAGHQPHRAHRDAPRTEAEPVGGAQLLSGRGAARGSWPAASPMPMNTRLVSGPNSRCTMATWSSISPPVRLRATPPMPEAQKMAAHGAAHLAADTHRVAGAAHALRVRRHRLPNGHRLHQVAVAGLQQKLGGQAVAGRGAAALGQPIRGQVAVQGARAAPPEAAPWRRRRQCGGGTGGGESVAPGRRVPRRPPDRRPTRRRRDR